jgi:hypothetical protein
MDANFLGVGLELLLSEEEVYLCQTRITTKNDRNF